MFLYAKKLKSKDIDIIVSYEELERLRAHHQLQKNDRLKKYEIHAEGIDIDIYVPFFSALGMPVEEVQQYTSTVEGFTIPFKEVLLMLKQKAWHDRGHSIKGEKDKIDIIALIQSGLDWSRYRALLNKFALTGFLGELDKILNASTQVPELDLNSHQYARFKRGILSALKS